MYSDAHKTTYGKLLVNNGVTEKLRTHIIKENTNIGYEVKSSDDVRVLFITGYSDEEKALPIFDQPVIIRDLSNTTYLVSDVRKYVSVKDQQPLTLTEVARDKDSLMFVITRAITLSDFMSGSVGIYKGIYKNIAASFSVYIRTILGGIVGLSPVEAAAVEVVTTYYVNTMLLSESQIKDQQPTIAIRTLKGKYSIPMTSTVLKAIISEVGEPPKSLDDLIEAIKTQIDPGKASLISTEVIGVAVANNWYGVGAADTMLISLEHIPTWLVMVYAVATNKNYKKSRLGTIVNNNNRLINPKELVKTLELHYKDRLHAV